jgi:hypothetical protein
LQNINKFRYFGYQAGTAVRGLDHKWKRTPVTDAGLQDYHLVLDYDEVIHLATEARTSTTPELPKSAETAPGSGRLLAAEGTATSAFD